MRANYAGNDEAAAKFREATGIPVYKFDVSDAQACEDTIKQIESDLGPIDIVVNNAGITRDKMFHRMSYEQWTQVMRTNLDSMFTVTRPVIEGMQSRGFGRIIAISSVNGQKGQMGQSNYSAAKAGVIGFAKALAQENAAKGITVNVIAPGYIATEMVKAVAGGCAQRQDHPADPGRASRRGGRNRSRRRLPRLRRGWLHHRLDPVDQWRPVHGVTGWLERWRA